MTADNTDLVHRSGHSRRTCLSMFTAGIASFQNDGATGGTASYRHMSTFSVSQFPSGCRAIPLFSLGVVTSLGEVTLQFISLFLRESGASAPGVVSIGIALHLVHGFWEGNGREQRSRSTEFFGRWAFLLHTPNQG